MYDENAPLYKTLLGVFLGAFIGFSPFHGFKLATIIALAIGLRLNKPLTIGVSYVTGMPPIIPILIFVSHQIGAFVLQNNNYLVFSKRHELNIQFVFENILQQYVGGIVFALIGALILTAIAYFVIFLHKQRAK